jgi:hypothetical protein
MNSTHHLQRNIIEDELRELTQLYRLQKQDMDIEEASKVIN